MYRIFILCLVYYNYVLKFYESPKIDDSCWKMAWNFLYKADYSIQKIKVGQKDIFVISSAENKGLINPAIAILKMITLNEKYSFFVHKINILNKNSIIYINQLLVQEINDLYIK